MLNGLAPILIFTFPINTGALSPLFNALSGVPLIGDLVSAVGLPIPLYLDEQLTGLYVESESKNLDIETTIEPRYDDKKPYIYQRALNSSISVNILASKDSVLLPALLALSDIIVTKIVSQKYTVSYANGPTLIIGGLLQGLNTSGTSDDDLIRIVLQIQKQDAKPAIPSAPSITKITGAIPTIGG